MINCHLDATFRTKSFAFRWKNLLSELLLPVFCCWWLWFFWLPAFYKGVDVAKRPTRLVQVSTRDRIPIEDSVEIKTLCEYLMRLIFNKSNQYKIITICSFDDLFIKSKFYEISYLIDCFIWRPCSSFSCFLFFLNHFCRWFSCYPNNSGRVCHRFLLFFFFVVKLVLFVVLI